MVESRKGMYFLIGKRFINEEYTYTELNQCTEITEILFVYNGNAKKNG